MEPLLLIYGHKGWIGSQFTQVCDSKGVKYIRGKVRCNQRSELERELKSSNCTHVVSFIGRTHGTFEGKKFTTIDYLEQPGKLRDNVRDNLFSPLQLALLCKEQKKHYTYLGTGCIFKYDDKHPFGREVNGFDEQSTPNFFDSSYSIVKGFTDQLMHHFENDVLNLRIRMPITDSENPRNFITKITNYEKICSIPNSMTVLPELLPVALDMLLKRKTGTVNLTNPGLVSHNEILDMFTEIVDPDFTYQNFSESELLKVLESGRSNNFLDTSVLEKEYKVTSIKESVRQVLKRYKQSYKKRTRLLVTGGCGFIGSNFINDVHKTDKYSIVNIDAMYYCANEKNVNDTTRNSPHYTFIRGDLNELDLVSILKKHRITHVVNFAAQSHVQHSFEDSIRYTHDNVLGTHKLLEACRKYKNIKRFVHVSTDEVYGESALSVDEKHKTEHSVLCPTNPYAATKAAAELIANSYLHSFGMPIIVTRGNNVYGPNQYHEKVIPRFIKLLKENKKVTIQGDGSCVRAFMHVNDTSKAFQAILEKGKVGEIYNIGCDEGMEYSVLKVAKMLIKLIKNTEDYNQWIEYVEDRPFNDKRYYIDNKKLKELGWNVTMPFEKGLRGLVTM